MINILTTLAKLANDLDAKGLFEEANLIDEVIKEAAVADSKTLQWQQNYNKKRSLKPVMPGHIKEDGIAGPATQQAMQKSKESELAQQVYNDPRKQPYDITKAPLSLK